MNFPEFWQEVVKRGTADTFENRTLARDAWDAALCAAQAMKWGETREPKGTLEWSFLIGKLHTWNKTTEGGAA